jgi:tetratricopeptide (TPR) repeat protein
LDYYLKALNEAEKLNDSGRRSACLNNIGSVYRLQGKYEQAIEYFNRSLDIEKKLNLPLQKSIRLYNLGESYKDIDSLDLALTYLNSSLIIEKKERSNEGIVYAELGIADVYIRIERYTDASFVLQKTAKRIGKEQIEEQIILHKLLGKLYKKTGKLKPALEEFINGEKISINYKIRTHLPELIKLQIEVHELRKDWQMATLKYAEYIKLNEEMNSFQIKNQLDDLNYRNELSKKQLEIVLIQEERDLARKNEQLEKDLRIFGQKITWFVILLMMSSVVLIVTGIKKLTNKNK